MTKPEAKARIEKLKKEISRHRYAYYVLDKPTISDSAYDSLEKELFALEKEFPDLITPDSPSQRVGGEPQKKFEKVRHERPMLSLNSIFSEEEVYGWVEKLNNYLEGEGVRTKDFEYYCDLKMDGLAIELVYENGILASASTRGDGQIGENITQNIKTIEAVPLSLEGNPSGRVVARGETFLDKKEFDRINKEQAEKGGKIYANPRNVAAGSVRQLDPKITASRKLNFYAYALLGDFKTHSEELKAAEKFGIQTNPFGKVCKNLNEVFAYQKKWSEEREKLPYEIDGVVVYVNDKEIFNRAGVIGKAPRAGIAFKFSPKEATTVVEDIMITVGRTGTLTPTAVMRPVNVGGVTITHATLHNMDEIERLGIKIGDTVVVSRAGDVIPQITQVLTELRTGKEKKFVMPKKCPIDGSPVVKEGVFYRCSNLDCGAVHKERLYHFTSAFDLVGLGPKIIDRFLDEGLINDAADLFSLEEGDINVLPGFGEKSAENLISELGRKKKISLPRFIYSLGILHVGEETSLVLAKELTKEKGSMSSPKEFLKAIQDFDLERLQQISDVGPVVAKSIHDWFGRKENEENLLKLDKVGVRIEPMPKEIKGKLTGQSFVLTGTLESMSRDEAKKKIRDLGGDISESVSKVTSYVVVGAEPGSKFDKAKKLGVNILSEKEFERLIS